MKFLVATALLVCSTLILAAQPQPNQGPPKPPPIEKRWEHDLPILKKYLTLTTKQEPQVKTAFYNFYKAMDAVREKSKGTRPAKEVMDKIKNTRDAELKKVLTAAQMEQLKKAEDELRPKPPGNQPPPPSN